MIIVIFIFSIKSNNDNFYFYFQYKVLTMIIVIFIFSIKSNNLQRDIGYCPQFDAVDPLLTGMEVLKFYSRLRGIPEKDVKEVRFPLDGIPGLFYYDSLIVVWTKYFISRTENSVQYTITYNTAMYFLSSIEY